MQTATKITIVDQQRDDALYCKYPGQYNRQGAFIELDCQTGILRTGFITEIEIPTLFSADHHRPLRWSIPCLRATVANQLMGQMADDCQKIIDGYSYEWDGAKNAGHYTPEALATIVTIERHLENLDDEWDASQLWEPVEAGV